MTSENDEPSHLKKSVQGNLQRIRAEMFAYSLEGIVVDGTPLDESSEAFDLDCEFTLRCDDGVLYKVSGWAVYITVLDA